MKFYIGIADTKWYEYLRDHRAEEMNFWRPGGSSCFKVLAPGELFLWKLRKPNNYIVGGGFFVRFSILPLSLAWEAFGQNNGTATREELAKSIGHYRARNGLPPTPDPFIGCIALTAPFFLPREQWIPVPESWAPSIVQGKGYDSSEGEGEVLWKQLQERLVSPAPEPNVQISTVATEAARFGQPRMVTPRLGQGSFRVAVTESYLRRCAMTGEKTLPVLEAAHIRPFAQEGPHLTSNGLLLRADLHTLFDRGLLTVTTDNRIEVSSQIKETWGNGKHYYELHGQELQIVPPAGADRPAPEFVEWHNAEVFRP